MWRTFTITSKKFVTPKILSKSPLDGGSFTFSYNFGTTVPMYYLLLFLYLLTDEYPFSFLVITSYPTASKHKAHNMDNPNTTALSNVIQSSPHPFWILQVLPLTLNNKRCMDILNPLYPHCNPVLQSLLLH